jgi:hypothetical protein
MRFLFEVVALVTLCLAASAWTAEAFNEVTHQRINENAASVARIDQAMFDSFLRESVGLFQGLQTPFRDDKGTTNKRGEINKVQDWLALGGTKEDEPLCRSARHFHDPLQPWKSAGLDTSNLVILLMCGDVSLPTAVFPSSVVWAQDGAQNSGEQQSWFDARESYFNALTGSSQDMRDLSWANAFRALGQVMHLVADSSVPEHVRNDTHILETALRTAGIRGYGSYEWWVEENIDFLPISGAPPFDRAILRQPTNSAAAPVPIARLVDTDSYTGAASGPGVTLGPAIGIAEFANANFFSEDTGNRGHFERDYPFPALDLLTTSTHPVRQGTNVRRYYKKGNDGGIPVDPVLAECVFDRAIDADGLPVPFTYNCVDENVWQVAATHLVPRAVDYAAGVLEYFFRGRIEIAPPARFLYGLASYVPGNAGAFTSLRFKVRNATPSEAAGSGRLVAVVQYRTPVTGEDLILNPFADVSGELFFAVSRELGTVALTDSFQELVFDFRDHPIPTNAADLFLTVAYRGPLGLEADAVAVGGKDLFEPDPLDLANVTDWECVQGTLYHVADSTAFPPYSPPGQVQRDVNHDGIQDLFGPMLLRNQFLKGFDLTQPVPIPAETSFDFSIAQESFAQFGRLMLLQDQPAYGAAVLARQAQQIPSGAVLTNVLQAAAMQGVINDVVAGPSGERVRRILASGAYRGVPGYHLLVFASAETIGCLPQTRALAPDLTRIDGILPAE